MNKYYIKDSKDGQYYFYLTASNGQTILTSETYTQKSNCFNGIDSCKSNSAYDWNYDRCISTNNQYYFVLKSSNGKIIGNSEMYTTRQNRENGIESVKRFGPISYTEDLTVKAARSF